LSLSHTATPQIHTLSLHDALPIYQPAQPLHRHEAARPGRLRRDDLAALRLRHLRPARPPRRRPRPHGHARRSHRPLSLLRRVFHGEFLLPSLLLRARPRSARAHDHRAVHTHPHRHPKNRQLRPDQPAPVRRSPARRLPPARHRRHVVLPEGGTVTRLRSLARLACAALALSAAARAADLPAGTPGDTLRARLLAAAPGDTVVVG